MEKINNNHTDSWSTAPSPIDDRKIEYTVDTEVLVVGGGNAGFLAAISAAQEGANTLLIEREDKISLIRTYVGGVNSKAQKRHGVEIDENDITNELMQYAINRADQRLIKLWATESGKVNDFIEDEILKPNDVYFHVETDTGDSDSRYPGWPTLHTAQNETSAVDIAPLLVGKAAKEEVEVRYNTRFIHLLQDNNDRVTGVVAEDDEGKYFQINATKGVILCTGGYANNMEMMRDLNPVAAEENVYSDAPSNYGEGIAAGTWVGADRDKMPAVLVFDRGIVPPGTVAKDTYIQEPFKNFFWMASQPFLKVNAHGERFANESIPYDYIVNSAGYQPGNLYVMLWDNNYGEHIQNNHTVGCARIEYPSRTGGLQTYVSAGGYDGNDNQIQGFIDEGLIMKADSIEELAKKLQLPVEKVRKTVNRYNQNCHNGVDEDFGKEKSRLNPVEEGPFYGCWLGGRVLSTLDGLRINNNMEVIREDGSPIQGLYAAGNDSGGFFAYTYPERIIGAAVSRAFTFGRLAGLNAATQ